MHLQDRYPQFFRRQPLIHPCTLAAGADANPCSMIQERLCKDPLCSASPPLAEHLCTIEELGLRLVLILST